MSNELTEYSRLDSLHNLVYLYSRISEYPRIKKDLFTLWQSAPHMGHGSFNNALNFLIYLSIIHIDENGKLAIKNKPQDNRIEEYIGIAVLKKLFDFSIINVNNLKYDEKQDRVFIPNSIIPLKYGFLRNILISADLCSLSVNRLYFTESGYTAITNITSDQPSTYLLKTLEKQLKKQAEMGDLAEKYVMLYEEKRLGHSTKSKRIKLLSKIAVSAGYDILSFNTVASPTYDRHIEVKSFNTEVFYISINELEKAKQLGDSYFIYLVDLNQINNPDYAPYILQNPAKLFTETGNWKIRPTEFKVSKLNL